LAVVIEHNISGVRGKSVSPTASVGVQEYEPGFIGPMPRNTNPATNPSASSSLPQFGSAVSGTTGTASTTTGPSYYKKATPTGGNPIFDKYKRPASKRVGEYLDMTYKMDPLRRVEPLSYLDGPVFKHRLNHPIYSFRLGDCQFQIPPEFIQLRTTNSVNRKTSMRQKSGVKTGTGHQSRQLGLSVYFNGMKEINGYQVESPFLYPYFVDGLRPLLAQFRRSPFLPVVNEYVNDTLGIYNVALSNVSISTVPGFPECLQVEIVLEEFNATPYTEMPNVTLHNMIDWDLYRWYYQQLLRPEGKVYDRNEKVTTRLQKAYGSLNGKFSMELIDESILAGLTTSDNLAAPSNFVEVINSEDGIVFENFACGYSNILTPLVMNKEISPTFQYMGGTDGTISMTFETQNDDLVSQMLSINEQCQRLILAYPKLHGIGFVKIKNELLALIGVEHIMITNMTVNTVPEFPGLSSISINAISYDPDQSDTQQMTAWKPFDGNGVLDLSPSSTGHNTVIKNTKLGLIRKIKQDNYIENKLLEVDLYPDLQLPTYEEVDAALERIRKWRNLNVMKYHALSGKYPREISMGCTGKHVDPDFYYFYPTEYRDTPMPGAPIGVGGSPLVTPGGSEITYASAENQNPLIPQFLSILYAELEAGAGYTYGTSGEILTAARLKELRKTWGDEHYDIDIKKDGKVIETVHADKWIGTMVYDCSGYVSYALAKAGITKQGWRGNHGMIRNEICRPIQEADLRPGDLVFDDGHVAVVWDSTQKTTIEANGTKSGVCHKSYKTRKYLYFGRISALMQNGISTKTGFDMQQKAVSPTVSSNLSYLPPENRKTMSKQIKFIEKFMRGAVQGYSMCGILPSVTIAQAIHETGWGEVGSLGSQYNNYFGVKASSTWKGAVTPKLKDNREGSFVEYCWYKSIEECLLDRATRVFGSSWAKNNYRDAIAAKDYATQATALIYGKRINANGHLEPMSAYATDWGANADGDEYHIDIIKTIQAWRLDQFDSKVGALLPSEAAAGYAAASRSTSTILPGTGQSLSFASTPSPMPINLDPAFYGTSITELSEITRDTKSISDWKTHEQDQYPIEHMCHDMVQYNRRGRMCRAFPTFMFMIIDENSDWLDGRKLWSNYYLYRSVMGVAIHQTRTNPISTATIELHNAYHYLTKSNPKFFDYVAAQDKGALGDWLYNQFGIFIGTPKATNEMIKMKNELRKDANLKAGCRIHLRLGYGNNAMGLPTTFTGTITEVDPGDVITFVAQSDGAELVKQPVGRKNDKQTNTWFTLGTEPSEIIRGLVADRENNLVSWAVNQWAENSAHGIQHFGQVTFHDDTRLIEKESETIKNKYWTKDDPEIIKAVDEAMASRFGDRTTGKTPAEIEKWKKEIRWDQQKEDLTAVIIASFQEKSNNEWMTKIDNQYIGLVNGTNPRLPIFFDLTKNIYLGTLHGKAADTYSSIFMNNVGGADDNSNIFGGEQNMRIYIFDKVPWDIMQVITQSCPEYVCQPMYHQFDSRIFFGHPHWLAKFKYEVRNSKEIWETLKPYSQFHHLDSVSDILDNQIYCDASDLHTNAIMTFVLGHSTTITPTIYADRTITFSQQKTKIIDSSFVQNWFGIDVVYETLNGYQAKNTAIRIGVSNIIDSFQKTYRGPLIVLGDASIKPCDTLGINDMYTGMAGVCEVREVVHSMSMETGFITSITPDLYTTYSSLVMKQAAYAPLMAITNAFAGMKITRSAGIAFANNAFRYIASSMTVSSAFLAMRAGWLMAAGLKNGSIIRNAGAVLKSVELSQALVQAKVEFDAIRAAKNTGALVKTAAGAGRLVSNTKNIAAGVKGAMAAAGTAVCPGLGTIVAWLATTIALEVLLVSVLDYFTYDNVIKTWPLVYNNEPFISGVNGSTKLMANWNDMGLLSNVLGSSSQTTPSSGGGGGGGGGGAW